MGASGPEQHTLLDHLQAGDGVVMWNLDSHPAPARQIDVWSDREAHAGVEDLGFTLDHIRRLESRQPDSVPNAANEVVAVAGRPASKPACCAFLTTS